MELAIEGGFVKAKQLDPLIKEANEIVSIMVAAIRSTRSRGR